MAGDNENQASKALSLALDELIKRRGTIKGQLTKFMGYLTNIKGLALSVAQMTELRMRISRMEELFIKFDEVHTEIEMKSDDTQFVASDREEFENNYYSVVSNAKTLLPPHSRTPSVIADGSDSDSSSQKSVLARQRVKCKLPTISLPKFSGLYNTWLEFHDTFNSLVHNNPEIDDVNKFQYLRASLEGSAASVIQSLEISNVNYFIAWKLICDRYNNKRLLVSNHVTAIFSIQPIAKESAFAIRNLVDNFNKNIRALESLKEPTKHWDTLLIHIGSSKLDSFTRRQWEEHLATLKAVTFESFLKFLSQRAVVLETMQHSCVDRRSAPPASPSVPVTAASSKQGAYRRGQEKGFVATNSERNNTVSTSPTCPKCKGEHWLYDCSLYLALTNQERADEVSRYKVCRNCLKPGHYYGFCKKGVCKICHKRHNTLIHLERPSFNNETSEQKTASTSDTKVALSAQHAGRGQVLLSTALVRVYDINNVAHTARCLLDNASTACFMSNSLCTKLNLPLNDVQSSVSGINNRNSKLTTTCKVKLASLNSNFNLEITYYVLETISSYLPCHEVDVASLNIPVDVVLADPKFYQPAPIDLLLGAEVFWNLLGSGKIDLGRNKPSIYETKLGWLVSGYCLGQQQNNPVGCNFANAHDGVRDELTRFWQLDEATIKPPSAYYTKEEQACEQHFVNNTTRLPNGRFCVKLPLKRSEDVLGNSYERARQCFLSVERRLQQNPTFKTMYIQFMEEYELLGDMSRVSNTSLQGYFLPHHGVLRMNSLTTKCRIVFNASSSSNSGISLNQILMVGPTIQDDLVSILLRFRQYTFVFSADVEKQYRRVVVHPDDRHLQKIIWRSDPSQPLGIYELNTVTYGTASAPFLAVRCLKQLALDCEKSELQSKSKLAEVIEHDFYVDDFISGCFDEASAFCIISGVSDILRSAGMNLRKWRSNQPSLLSDIHSETEDLNLGGLDDSKTLGLGWRCKSDNLYFSFDLDEALKAPVITKRLILSTIGRLFDPLGLLAPCVVQAKILLQKLWLSKVSWDDEIPSDIEKQWREIIRCLPSLNTLEIPRQVTVTNFQDVELHVFTDASLLGYGACLYVKTTNSDETCVRLLMAKSRVAPIKPLSIPKLELSGALIGSHLYQKALSALRLPVTRCVFWTDSTVVLGWLKMLPSQLKPFVKNRVSDILEITGDSTWRHVPTNCNPADYVSRGLDACTIVEKDMWWCGPEYLRYSSENWPKNISESQDSTEIQSEVVMTTTVDKAPQAPPGSMFAIDMQRYSNINFLQRVTAYTMRFINNYLKLQSTSNPKAEAFKLPSSNLHETNHLSTGELDKASRLLCKLSQIESFQSYELVRRGCLPMKDPLTTLNPFIDSEGVMRVGGRLHNSKFDYDKKHPIILDAKHNLTKMLFKREHLRSMHAGPQAMLFSVRQAFWPIRGRNLAKLTYRNCVICTRMVGATVTPIMGNLPKHRLTAEHPFHVSGVDYAGPIMAASKKGRGAQLIKVYIAVFVCFATKAIHLELVSDLSTDGFMSVFRRFVARRSLPAHLYSDNGTQFVGFANDLKRFLKQHSVHLSEQAATENINVHFVPPFSPHFSGLMESGVKSTKHHLKRILANCHLTFEEIYTALCQIEAILNSRPLTPLSSDPNDFLPLTPGHFLVGRSLTALPTPVVIDEATNRLNRYQRIEQLRQHFWTRWYKEYVSELQLRYKWKKSEGQLLKDTMVLIKDSNLPPMKWRLGRIESVIPGTDGVCRVADIRTSSGVVRRNFSKICPLPSNL